MAWSPDGARTADRRIAADRAYTRAALTGLASAAGLEDVTWRMPHETGFFQPVMTIRNPLERYRRPVSARPQS